MKLNLEECIANICDGVTDILAHQVKELPNKIGIIQASLFHFNFSIISPL